MKKLVAYIRISTDKQDLNNQKFEILDWASNRKIHIDEWVEVTMSSRKSEDARKISDLKNNLNEGDTLIVTELSRLGRSTAEVLFLINSLIKNHVQIIILKQNLNLTQHDMNSKIMVTMFSLFAELERDIISERIKASLKTKKERGIKLGKPKGIIQKSKFDIHVDKIKELLNYGLSYKKIAQVLGLSDHSQLFKYVKRHNLKN